MLDPINNAETGTLKSKLQLVALIFLHVFICGTSLLYALDYTSHRIAFDASQLPYAIASLLAFDVVGIVFVFARFSFGYFIGFYLYTMVLGFLWLSWFTDLQYDHQAARYSAVASAIGFLLPALFITAPAKQAIKISPKVFDHLLTIILALAVMTIIAGGVYNFRLVALDNISQFRAKLELPTILRYLSGIVPNVLLPFAFACFVMQRKRWRAGAVLILLLFFYPITLTKLSLFTPAWLILLLILSKLFESRAAAILSLLLPMFAGVILVALFSEQARSYFDLVNFRMITIPASAMNVYNHFFSNHELTYFCQVSFLKQFDYCPYHEQLSIILERAYGLGNFNASLFATEGIASVGTYFAPAVVFLCGLVIGVANRMAAGLSPRFILVSGAVLPQIFLNVPLTVALVTHGAAILFFLWYITPRTIFK